MEWPSRLLDVYEKPEATIETTLGDGRTPSASTVSQTVAPSVGDDYLDQHLPSPYFRLDVEITIANDDLMATGGEDEEAEQSQERVVTLRTMSESAWKHRLMQLIEDGLMDDWLETA